MTANKTTADGTKSFTHLVSDQQLADLLLLWPCVWFVIVSLGLASNGLIIRTFLRIGLDDSITISFFVLAVSDFAHVFFPFSSIIIHVFMYLEANVSAFFSVQPLVVFVISVNLTSTFNNLTTFITTFLAVQRCLCIVRPLHFKGMFSKTLTWCIMGVFVAVGLVPALAHVPAFAIERTINPANNKSQYIILPTSAFQKIDYFVQTYFMISLVGSHILIFGSMIIMGYGLRASVRFRKGLSVKPNDSFHASRNESREKNLQQDQPDKERQNSKERAVIVQVALLCCIFLVTNLPKLVLAIVNVLSMDFSIGGRYKNLYMIFVNVRITFDYINSAANFPIYYRYNTRFRKLCFTRPQKPKEVS